MNISKASWHYRLAFNGAYASDTHPELPMSICQYILKVIRGGLVAIGYTLALAGFIAGPFYYYIDAVKDVVVHNIFLSFVVLVFGGLVYAVLFACIIAIIVMAIVYGGGELLKFACDGKLKKRLKIPEVKINCPFIDFV